MNVKKMRPNSVSPEGLVRALGAGNKRLILAVFCVVMFGPSGLCFERFWAIGVLAREYAPASKTAVVSIF